MSPSKGTGVAGIIYLACDQTLRLSSDWAQHPVLTPETLTPESFYGNRVLSIRRTSPIRTAKETRAGRSMMSSSSRVSASEMLM